jgi:hypothetical protein
VSAVGGGECLLGIGPDAADGQPLSADLVDVVDAARERSVQCLESHDHVAVGEAVAVAHAAW